MLILLLFLMLLSVSISYFLGFFFGRKGIFFLSNFIMFLCLLIVIYYFCIIIFYNEKVIFINLGYWFNILYLTVAWTFLIDSLTVVMLIVVFTVSMCVHMYSCYYMYDDINSSKFMSFLTFFTFFMTILVISSNFIILFLGWEGVGLCSFLLISFWNTRLQANKSALKAMLINRIGDYFILIGIILIVITFKTLDFYTVFSLVHLYSFKVIINFYFINITIIDLICFLLLIGAVTKSAQLGLHGWLPDAMEGPTPVSALIHAATMVTAGVFLIIRCSYIFEFSSLCLNLLTYISALTIVLFGFVGLAQYDIKKIIAYSTCSQLGYMMLACSLSGYNLALYHLLTHASFKALLFLSAGSIIHTMNNEQDLRKLNGIYYTMPLISILFLIGSLSLIGFPYLSGFYSKDAIIELSFYYLDNPFIFFMSLIGVFLTAMYSVKILYFIFFKDNFNYYMNSNILKNYSFNYLNFVPLIILAILSIFVGYFTKVIFTGIGNDTFYGTIFVLMKDNNVHSEFLGFTIKILPIFVVISSIYIFYDTYYNVFDLNNYFYFISYNLFLFFNKRMFFDSLLNLFISFFFFKISFKIFFIFDKGILEVFGPFGISNIFNKIKDNLYINTSTGYLFNVVLHIFFLIVLIFIVYIYIFLY